MYLFADLATSLGADSRTISYGITIRHLVNCFAAILGLCSFCSHNFSLKKEGRFKLIFIFLAGFSFNWFSRQIQYAASLLVYGLLMIVLPLIQDVTLYLASSALIGLASAFIDCATNLWVFELFAENINLHVLIVHFSYSVGKSVFSFAVAGRLLGFIFSTFSSESTDTASNLRVM